jgi:hypothetical protein
MFCVSVTNCISWKKARDSGCGSRKEKRHNLTMLKPSKDVTMIGNSAASEEVGTQSTSRL